MKKPNPFQGKESKSEEAAEMRQMKKQVMKKMPSMKKKAGRGR